ncbi:hypothetical protein OGAPHI_006698 [Ogataea philodendri]|uniref:DNA 3'-5' helicase n=1 Tax=Ogataea philodendri TaxID=1378263 RepID=A0A9P8T0C6_9ASCO|nr:uncharacterized protein OGAPHI_006698 [Ogataea philodendri]KAH3661291.1 hypothetical protein OGAPHI_006698 [Ogataea philodendri]
MYQFLDDLNADQRAAATAPLDGVLLVLAGPGTGKTKVITARVAYLMLHYKLPPEDIVVATFTKKAANEMVERLDVLLAQFPEVDHKKLMIGTFHSICVRILRRYGRLIGLNSGFKIADEADSRHLVKKAVKTLSQEGVDLASKEQDVKSYKNYISSHKNKAQLPDDVPSAKSANHRNKYLDIYREYQEELLRNNVIDFDDCLLLTHTLLKKHPYCMGRVKHVLVDEFQDTNAVQLGLVYMLSGYNESHLHNVTVVGDPDQSIYGFRNAEAENFFRMEDYYRQKGVTVSKVSLTQNYRSTSNILNLAEQLMGQQFGKREQKKLKSNKKVNLPVELFSSADNKVEAISISKKIKELVDGAVFRCSDVAILLRAGFLSRVIEQELIHSNLPYQVVHGRSFWENKEIRLMMNFMRAVASDMDWLGYSRCLEFHVAGLGPKSMQIIEDLFMEQRAHNEPGNVLAILEGIAEGRVKGIMAKSVAGIKEVLDIIKSSRKLLLDDKTEQEQLSTMFNNIVTKTKLVSIIAKERADKHDSPEEEIEANLNELQNQLVSFNIQEETLLQDAYETEDLIEVADESFDALAETSASLDKLTQFLDSVYLYEETKDAKKTAPKITITTVHGSKGLEWPVVFVPALCDGILPSQYALNTSLDEAKRQAALDEERRCMYVAVTRAKERLFLSYHHRALGFSMGDQAKTKSRFLNLPKGFVQSSKAAMLKGPPLNLSQPTSRFANVMRSSPSLNTTYKGFQPASKLTGNAFTPEGLTKISKPTKKRLGMGRPLRFLKK